MTDIAANTAPLQLTIHPLPQSADGSFWNGETPDFKDILDTLNPLEHLPVVSTLYQSLTDNTPSTGSKLAGGALFGGPLGFLAALFDTIVQNATGADIAGNVMAAIEGKPVPALQQQNGTQLAMNEPRDGLSPNQRAAFNAYVQAGMLA